jgi:hypothetical protein
MDYLWFFARMDYLLQGKNKKRLRQVRMRLRSFAVSRQAPYDLGSPVRFCSAAPLQGRVHVACAVEGTADARRPPCSHSHPPARALSPYARHHVMPVSSRTAEDRGVPAVHELGGGMGWCIPLLAFPTLIHGGPGTVGDLVPVLWRAAAADRCCSRTAR